MTHQAAFVSRRGTPAMPYQGTELTALERNSMCPSGTRRIVSAPVQLFTAAGIARVVRRIRREIVQIRRLRGSR
jgi:hypothetical protein